MVCKNSKVVRVNISQLRPIAGVVSRPEIKAAFRRLRRHVQKICGMQVVFVREGADCYFRWGSGQATYSSHLPCESPEPITCTIGADFIRTARQQGVLAAGLQYGINHEFCHVCGLDREHAETGNLPGARKHVIGSDKGYDPNGNPGAAYSRRWRRGLRLRYGRG